MARHKENGPSDGGGRKKRMTAAATVTSGAILLTGIQSAPPAGTHTDVSPSVSKPVENPPGPLWRDLISPSPTPAKPTPKPTPKPTKRPTVRQTTRPAVPARWRETVLDEGRKLFGIRYTWGGESIGEGFDCSGYTWYVYRKAGIKLPRVAHDQMRSYALKRTSNPQPGDLVFFLDRSGHAYHVGIYVRPGVMYVAPHRGAVIREERIWDDRAVYRTPRNPPK